MSRRSLFALYRRFVCRRLPFRTEPASVGSAGFSMNVQSWARRLRKLLLLLFGTYLLRPTLRKKLRDRFLLQRANIRVVPEQNADVRVA